MVTKEQFNKLSESDKAYKDGKEAFWIWVKSVNEDDVPPNPFVIKESDWDDDYIGNVEFAKYLAWFAGWDDARFDWEHGIQGQGKNRKKI